MSFSGLTTVLPVDLHFWASMSGFSNNCCFHARCHFPCRVLFSALIAGSSVGRCSAMTTDLSSPCRFQRRLSIPVSTTIFNPDCGVPRLVPFSMSKPVFRVRCRCQRGLQFQSLVSRCLSTDFMRPAFSAPSNNFMTSVDFVRTAFSSAKVAFLTH